MATSPLTNPINLPSPNSTIATDTHTVCCNSSDSIVSLNLPIAIKLNESNFLTWKLQVLPLIHGYDLGRFLDSPPPDTTIQSDTGQIELNPAYLPWHRQDQLLLGWLRSSLTETLLAHVLSATTTRDFWRSLEDYYASTSRARLHELKRQIQTASKGGKISHLLLSPILPLKVMLTLTDLIARSVKFVTKLAISPNCAIGATHLMLIGNQIHALKLTILNLLHLLNPPPIGSLIQALALM